MAASAQAILDGAYNHLGIDYISPETNGAKIVGLTQGSGGTEWWAIDNTNFRFGINTTSPANYLDCRVPTSVTDNAVLAAFLHPSQATTKYARFDIGKAQSNYQAGYLAYYYDSGTPASSIFTLGVFGRNPIIQIDGADYIYLSAVRDTAPGNNSGNNPATVITPAGAFSTSAFQTVPVTANLMGDEGTVISIRQDGTEEGTISVSGTTVSYNAFCGGHWSQLAEGDKATLKPGMVVSAVNELSEWKYLEVTSAAGKTKRFAYTGKRKVGEFVKHGIIDAEVKGEKNERLCKFKLTTTAGDPAVYGVFSHWDEDGDAIIHSLGASSIRVVGPTNAGDLLQSSTIPGIAIKQSDNIVRASTIGKVTKGKPTASPLEEYVAALVLYAG